MKYKCGCDEDTGKCCSIHETHCEAKLDKMAEQYEKELAQANAKIVELEAFVRCGCGKQENICHRCWSALVTVKTNKLQADLSTANKKAEKLVEALEEIKPYFEDRSDCDHNGITFISNEENKLLGVIEQAIKEYRGEK